MKEVSPDTGTTAYTYDEAGNLATLEANDGRAVQYGYDDLSRLEQVTYEDEQENITYGYDQGTNGIGHLTNISDPSGTTVLGYDALGRVTSYNKTVGSVAFSTAYTWDEGSGRPATITYPSGRVVTYTPDTNGNILSVTTTYSGTTQTLAENILYAPFGPVTSFDLGNGLSESRDPDPQYRPNSVSVSGVVDLTYTYNDAGYISGVSNALARPGSFKPSVPEEDENTTFGYEAGTNRLDTITGSQASAILTYDDNGNIAAKGDLTFGYFQDNRLASVRQDGTVIAEYKYNSFGQRTRKTVSGETTLYHYDLDGNLICESSADGTVKKEYVYLGSLPLAMIVYGTEVKAYFYHTNHLGTPVAMTDDGGEVVWQANYSPFGTVEITVETVENNLRMPGQYYDAETGLHYNWHRYYEPTTGRYLTPDPIGLEGGINPFVYAEANPINFIDPTGEFAFLIPAIAVGLEYTTGMALADLTIALAMGYSANQAFQATQGNDNSNSFPNYGSGGACPNPDDEDPEDAIQKFKKQYEQYSKRTNKQLEKAIKTHNRRIVEHKNYIADPKSKVPHWSNLTKRHQNNLLHHWNEDIKRHDAYKRIAEHILKGR